MWCSHSSLSLSLSLFLITICCPSILKAYCGHGVTTVMANCQLCCGALDEGEGETQPVLVPSATFDGSKVAHVEASSELTMVVTADSVLWVCGFGICGQLGTGTNKNALIPTRVGGSD